MSLCAYKFIMGKKKQKKNIVRVPLQIIDVQGEGYHLLLKIKLFNRLFTLVLDTGASKTAFDHTLLTAASGNAVITASDMLSTGLGTNCMVSSTISVSDLYIGDLLVKEFEAAVLDLSTINVAYRQIGQPEVLGVLGGDVLMKYKAVIDYSKQLLKLKQKGSSRMLQV